MKLSHAFSTLIITILSSCGQYELSRKLLEVESYINEHPDSALNTISSIDINRNTSERNRAHHALLHAMVLDKCYIDVKNDSLAKIASEYYSRFRRHPHKTKALYYLGKSYLYNGENNKAIIELTRAEESAGENDSLYLGMIKMAQAAVYTDTYNSNEALSCIFEAIDIYQSLSAERYHRIARLRLAQTYSNLMQYDKARQIYDELLNIDCLDEDIYSIAINSLAFLLTISPEQDCAEASRLYGISEEKFGPECFDLADRWAYTYVNLLSGGTDNLIISPDNDTTGTSVFWKYRISKLQGNNVLALSLLERYVDINETEVSQALKQSIARTQRDYYESQKETMAYKARNRGLSIAIILVSFILFALIVTSFILKYIRKQAEEKNKYLHFAEEISRQLKIYENEDIPSLKSNFIALYKTRFETLGKLCDQYINSQSRTDKENYIYKKVMEMVGAMKQDIHSRERFEEMLNKDLDNVMTNIRKDFPRFKELDFVIFSYMAVGFDATTISNLTGESISNIYTRKSRIRQKISASSTPNKDLYLRIMG